MSSVYMKKKRKDFYFSSSSPSSSISSHWFVPFLIRYPWRIFFYFFRNSKNDECGRIKMENSGFPSRQHFFNGIPIVEPFHLCDMCAREWWRQKANNKKNVFQVFLLWLLLLFSWKVVSWWCYACKAILTFIMRKYPNISFKHHLFEWSTPCNKTMHCNA